MTVYPSRIDGYAQIRVVKDTVSEVLAHDHNDLRSAVLALEQTLGLKPQSIYGTVGQRIEFFEDDAEGHYAGTSLRHTDGQIDSALKGGSPFSLSAGTVQTQLSEVVVNLDSAIRYDGSAPTTFVDGYALPASFTTSAITETVSILGSGGASAKLGIDNSSWTRLDGPPAPGSVQAAMNRVDGYMNTIYNEVEAARESPVFLPASGSGGGTFADLSSHLNAADLHARTIISCTDGTTSTGGMFNGPDALANAIDTIDTLSDEYGGIILLRSGTYVVDVAKNIYNSVQIIGVEEEVIIEDGLALGSPFWMISFRGDQSTLKNVQLISQSGHTQHIRIEGDNCIIEQLKSNGTIDIGTIETNYNCLIKNSIFGTPSGSAVDSIIIGEYSENVRVEQCKFYIEGHNIAIDAYGGFFGVAALIDQCYFVIGDDSMAIRDGGGGGTIVSPGTDDLTSVHIRDCKIFCTPNTAGRPVVQIASDSAHIDGLCIDVIDLEILAYLMFKETIFLFKT